MKEIMLSVDQKMNRNTAPAPIEIDDTYIYVPR